jgi:hypothetical protein
MTTTTEYVPGVCNIGPAEIGRRRQAGWLGLGATALLWALLWLLRVPAAWRLLLFIPAATGASGFLQAALHFCAGFGSRGLLNFGPELGKTESVQQAEFRLTDRRRAGQIGLYSALVGIAVALAAFFLVPPPLG